MARNEEKANAVLNRFWEAKREEKRGPKQKRPFLASGVPRPRGRRQMAPADPAHEIGRKVSEIQNPGLGEHRLRDLNDEINKLIREKGHWEERILELGGADHKKQGPQVTDAEGRPSTPPAGRGSGHCYFGAAKELPGEASRIVLPMCCSTSRRFEIAKVTPGRGSGYRHSGAAKELPGEESRIVLPMCCSTCRRLEIAKVTPGRGSGIDYFGAAKELPGEESRIVSPMCCSTCRRLEIAKVTPGPGAQGLILRGRQGAAR